MLPTEISLIVSELIPAHGPGAIVEAVERATRFGGFDAGDIASTLQIGPDVAEPRGRATTNMRRSHVASFRQCLRLRGGQEIMGARYDAIMNRELITELSFSTPLDKKSLRASLRHVAGAGSRELASVEAKAGFDNSNRAWLQVLRVSAAMANTDGGLVIFGISDQGDLHGLQTSLAIPLDPARVTDKFAKYSHGDSPQTLYSEDTYYGKSYGFLQVLPGDAVIVFDKIGQYHDPQKNKSETVFHEGVICVRTPGKTAPASSRDVSKAIDRMAEQRTKRLLARIEQVASVPLDAELIVRSGPESPSGYVLVDRGEGIPVTIASDPTAHALPLKEVLTSEQPFSSIDAEVISQVRHWKQSDSSHRVPRRTVQKWYLERAKIAIDESTAEFCFLSACSDHGYPMFWATKMEPGRLLQVVHDVLTSRMFPERLSMAYVVGALFWDDREKILVPLLRDVRKQVKGQIHSVIDCSDPEQFRRHARFGGMRAPVEGQIVEARAVLEGNDRDLAQEFLNQLLKDDIEDGKLEQNARSFALQLDIYLHFKG